MCFKRGEPQFEPLEQLTQWKIQSTVPIVALIATRTFERFNCWIPLFIIHHECTPLHLVNQQLPEFEIWKILKKTTSGLPWIQVGELYHSIKDVSAWTCYENPSSERYNRGRRNGRLCSLLRPPEEKQPWVQKEPETQIKETRGNGKVGEGKG